jgi:MFS family permease
VVGNPGARAPLSSLRFLARDIQLPNSLREGPFRRYWLAQMLALIALWIQNTAANLVFLSLTTSAFKIGLINIAAGVPMLLLSLFGGVVADRINRRKIVMTTQTIIAMLSLCWAFLIFTDAIAYWHVLTMAVIGGIVISFDQPAGQSLLSQLVRRENLPEALALTSMSGNSTRMYAPLLGGVVIGIVGLSAAFVGHSIALLVFVGTVFSLRRMIDRPTNRLQRQSPLVYMREGLRYVKQSDALIGLVAMTGLISFLTIPVLLVLMPFYMTDVLGGSDQWVPISTSSFGLGSFAAAVTLFRGSKHEVAAGRRMKFTLSGMILGLVWLSISPAPIIAIPGVILCGCCFEMGLLQILTRLQQLSPDEIRGRIMSLNSICLNGAMPLATLAISTSIQFLGMKPVMAVCACLLATVAFLLWRRYTHKAFLPSPVLHELQTGTP